MGYLLNLLIIILATIAFLFIYFFTTREGNKKKKKHLGPFLSKGNYESGEEFIHLEEIKKLSPQGESFDEENYIRLLNRDPYKAFAYWQIKNEDYYQHQPYLRLFYPAQNEYQDIAINHQALNWYLDIKADELVQVIIGYKTQGIFTPLAKSNIIQTPPAGPSQVLAENCLNIEDLMYYSQRIEMDSLTLIHRGKKRLQADSYSFQNRN